MTKFWRVRAQARDPKVVELDIYGDIEGDWYDWYGGKHESETSADYIKKELKAHGDISRIELHINSLGGSVFEANAIANMIRRLDCETVAYIDGFACSAASAVACACKKVVMPRNTVLMIHNPWQVAIGNSTELRKAADDLDVLGEAYRTIYLDKAGDKLDEAKLIQMLDAETYLTAEQALDIGLCDEVEQFDAVMQEPDDGTKQAAAKAHVDIDKICAMVSGEAHAPALTEPPKQAPTEPQAKKKPEEEPEVLPETPDRSEFEAKAETLIFNYIK